MFWFSFASGAGGPHPAPWQTGPGYRARPLPVPPPAQVGFSRVPSEAAGIRFTNVFTLDDLARHSNLMNGSGVALGDYDGDGRCDVFLCGLTTGNRLYRNQGAWQFEDVTAQAGLSGARNISRGAAFADVNGDGRLDLLTSSFGGPSVCYLNTPEGRFIAQPLPTGVVTQPGSTSLALADVDGNGTLDLYLCNFGVVSVFRDGVRLGFRTVNGQPQVTGRFAQRVKIVGNTMLELGEPDTLYLNDGTGRFSAVPWETEYFRDESGAPMSAPWDFGLSVQMRDLNADGHPDIYVCNDFHTPDRIWINDGRGHFRLIDPLAIRHTSAASMGVDGADIDRDGHVDLFVVEMLARDHRDRIRQASSTELEASKPGELDNRPQLPRNVLFWNRGDGTFAEIADFAGLAATDWCWQPVFLDVDLDGFEDLLFINGISHDLNHMDFAGRMSGAGRQDWRTTLPPFVTPHYAFRNRGDLTFEDSSAAWGFNGRQIANSLAWGDLDDDGDLDLVISCLNAPPLLYRNDAAAARVAVRLKGRPPNTQGIGAQIRVRGAAVPQSQEMIAGGYYLAGNEPLRVFAAGSASNRLTLEVTWRSGLRSVVSNALPDSLYELDEAAAYPASPASSARADPAVFQDVSPVLSHRHHEEAFDDFALQPLLPRRLSQAGPGVAWFDLDGDGHEDLILGSGRGGTLTVFRADGAGGFARLASEFSLPDDLTGLVGWIPAPGERVLLAGLAHYEAPTNSLAGLLAFQLQNGKLRSFPLPELAGLPPNVGPLAVADYDADGDLDLFVGGRPPAGRYPTGAFSRLYRNEQRRLVLDPANQALLEKAGMVNNAVFSDLTGDGWPELVLACEWGPVRVLKNQAGTFSDATQELGLAAHVGWWTGVETGDLNGDGLLDIVAANWGLNSPYQPTPEHPVAMFYGDLDADSRPDLIEGYFAPELGKLVPRRNLKILGAPLPFVKTRFVSHQAYSEAGVAEILGERLDRTPRLEAVTLASMVFLNQRTQFVAQPLPRDAQLAPAFGVCVADLDGDGHEDVFLSQNFFATHPELSRLDAGRGLWLRGDGQGKLLPVPGQQSGVTVYGEQRGCAVGDFDRDGRADLVVTQNGAATRLFRNQAASRGLRVRVAGPPGNPTGIGVVLRLGSGEHFGPAREVKAGSGYWSQHSAISILTMAAPERVQVRWPGGKTAVGALPPQAREILIGVDGSVTAGD